MSFSTQTPDQNPGRTTIDFLFVALLSITLVSCNVNLLPDNTKEWKTTCRGNCTLGPGAQGVKVFVEPDAGYFIITDAIRSARKSVWLEMYLLTEKHVINALEEAANRGLDVRVMLEGHPYGGGGVSPELTLDRLRAANIQATTTSPAYRLTHAKMMLIDGRTAFIMTSNLTQSALGGSSHAKNREFGIIDTDPKDVQALVDIFRADWQRRDIEINNPHLVISPLNARYTFMALIQSAQKTIFLEAEEMKDDAIIEALVDAAQRGIQVRVILPAPRSTLDDGSTAEIQTLQQGNVEVKEATHLYMHAKIILVDGQKAFVGSENISTPSLDSNREIGILIADRQVLNTLQQTFQYDWQASHIT
jgi:cardiolipin synthase